MHTPYDGSSKLFTIGLTPLGEAPWLERDQRLPGYLAEKERLLREARHEVFGAEAGSEAAQAETLRLITDYLGVSCETATEAPLVTAARWVAEDLALLHPTPEGWRLTAGVICFPSSWSLPEKLGKVLHHAHAPVPDFAEGTRHAAVIERIFDNLRPEQPVLRWNYSLYGTDTLHHPHLSPVPRFGPKTETVYIRVERQTLRRLPETGAILFTIGIHLTPIEDVTDRAGLIAQLEALNPAQLEYKGLTAERDRLIRRLRDAGS